MRIGTLPILVLKKLRAKAWVALVPIISAGVLLVLGNAQLPIARNAVVYARAAVAVAENHIGMIELARDPLTTSGKPIIFPLIIAPFVSTFGANVAAMIASFFGTVFYLLMAALAIRRLNIDLKIAEKWIVLELAVLALNPLVMYQFWSAYPDSLFAGLVILTFLLVDRIIREPKQDTRFHMAVMAVVITIAIHVKLYGVILVLASTACLAANGYRIVKESRYLKSKLVILALSLLGICVMLWAAKRGAYPLVEFSSGAGADTYSAGLMSGIAQLLAGSIRIVALTFFLVFNGLLVCLLCSAAWRAWLLRPAIFVTLYVGGLLLFWGTSYNMRYFLPVLPFVVPTIVVGLLSMPMKFREVVLACYALMAVPLTLIFNVQSVFRRADPWMALYLENGEYNYEGGWLDNLRLPVQLELKEQIAEINKKVTSAAPLYWSSAYYDLGTHDIAEHLGVKLGLDVHYVMTPLEIAPIRRSIYLYQYGAKRWVSQPEASPPWALVRQVGYGLFQLSPFFVECQLPNADESRMKVVATVDSGLGIAEVEFWEGERLLGSVRDQPFELQLHELPTGRHEIRVEGRDANGHLYISSAAVCYQGIMAFERSVVSNTDVAFERVGGRVFHSYGPLQVSTENDLVAIRFHDVYVPRNARIRDAFVEFAAAETVLSPAEFEIWIEDSSASERLMPLRGNISDRELTSHSLKWRLAPWVRALVYRSPNIGEIVEELAARKDWHAGESLVLVIRVATGRRLVAVPGSGNQSPRIYIEMEEIGGLPRNDLNRTARVRDVTYVSPFSAPLPLSSR